MGWFETTNIGKYSSPKKARIEPWNSKNDCRSIRLINIYHFPYWVVLFVYLGGKARSFSEFQTFQSKTCRILWGVSKPVLFFGKFRWFCWNMFCFGSQIFNYSFFFRYIAYTIWYVVGMGGNVGESCISTTLRVRIGPKNPPLSQDDTDEPGQERRKRDRLWGWG